MTDPLHILGVSGSLRRASTNTGLLRAAGTLPPPGVTFEIADISKIPPFNQDLENELPAPVREFKDKVRHADGILFAVAEYNYSVSGVLKNAIDWASRPPADNVWAGKPAAIVSSSVGILGGSRAQYHLRQSFVFLGIRPVTKPEVFVTFNTNKFDSVGDLTDPEAKKFLEALVIELVRLTREVRATARLAAAP